MTHATSGPAVLRAFLRWGSRYPWLVVVFSLAMTLAGIWGIGHIRVDQDLKALLPRDAPAVRRLDAVVDRLGTASDVVVAIESSNPAANRAYGELLSERLKTLPGIRFVQFRRDMSFLEKNALLLAPLPDLVNLRRHVVEQIRRETRRHVVEDLEDDASEPTPKTTDTFDPEMLGPRKLLPQEYMEADDGRILVLKARPEKPSTDVAFTTSLVERIQDEIVAATPTAFAPDMGVSIKGEYGERVRQAGALRTDLFSTGAFTLIALLGATIAYYRRLRAALIVFIPVVVSTIVTLGLAGLLVGEINIATTFIFAVLLGLGEDFAMYCLARFTSEQRRGNSTETALARGVVTTGGAVAIGASTTIASFFLLCLGRFQGFAQFGLLGGIGVLLALLFTYLLVPALVVLFERVRPWSGTTTAGGSPRLHRAAPSPTPRPAPLFLAAAVLLAGAAIASYGFVHASDIPFEHDFTKLGRRGERDAPSVPGKSDFRDAMGRYTSFSPAVALCDDAAQCAGLTRLLGIVARADDDEITCLRAKGRGPACDFLNPNREEDPDAEDGFEPTDPLTRLERSVAGTRLLPTERDELAQLGVDRVVAIRSRLEAFLSLQLVAPGDQEEKLLVLRDLRARLDKKMGLLKGETREKAERLRRYLEVDQPFRADALPAWLVDLVGEKDGTLGRTVVLWNNGSKSDLNVSRALHEAFFDLPDGTGNRIPVAATYFVTVEVMQALVDDIPIVFGAATVATMILVFLLFRSVRATALVAFSVAAATGWLAAAYYLLGWKLDLFNVVALPLLFGMGSDYPIQFYARWREDHDLAVLLRETAGAVFIAALTTVVGFAGLLLAGHVGVRSLGIASALGVAFCFVAATTLVPSVLALATWTRERRCPHHVPRHAAAAAGEEETHGV